MTAYNLSRPQKQIYDMERFAGGAISIICGSVLAQRKYDSSDMKKAIGELFKANDALRTRIVESLGEVKQEVREYQERAIEVLRFSDEATIEKYGKEYAAQPLPLAGPLCEIKILQLPSRSGAIIKMHHIIGDAWSLSLLASQFFELLNGGRPVVYSYLDYVRRENEYLSSKRFEGDRRYFLEQFEKCREVTYLSERGKGFDFAAKRKSFVLTNEETARIKAYAKAHRTSPYVLFLTVLAVYISRVKMNAEKLYIGTAVLNRSGVREKNTVGAFINTVPLLVEVDSQQSFSDCLSATGASAMALFRHQRFNYDDCLSSVREEYGFTERLFDIILSYQNSAIDASDGVDSMWFHNGFQVENLQIHIEDRDNVGVFNLHYDYRDDCYAEFEINALHTRLQVLMHDAISQESKTLHHLSIMSAAESRKLLSDFNRSDVVYQKERLFQKRFEEQVVDHSKRVAIIACDKTLTYGELNEQANRVAHSLMDRGVKARDIVAFSLSRKSYLFVVMLGIIKAGAAYLPINPDYPRKTIDYMIEDSKPVLYVTDADVADLLLSHDDQNPSIAVGYDDLCYCIYTSGSTGQPKGALITQGNVANLIDDNGLNVVHRIICDSDRRIVALSTIWFDMFVLESMVSLANGKEIVFADEQQSKMQRPLNMLLKAHPVDVMQTTPTKMKILMADDGQLDYLANIKKLILGGESLDETLIKEIREKTDAVIFNNYGPTEATVWSTSSQLIDAEDIVIGRPIANTQVYVTDNYLNLMPIGVVGEICIAGDGVGVGYLNRPELTAQKFVANPFGTGKLYKTGDLGYWREDGNLVFVGRNDFQVKIRGLRVELGEIESAMNAIDGVLQSVVVVREDEAGHQVICAFYTGERLRESSLRLQLGMDLPKHMVPHVFVWLEKMPQTSSGKVDRKALPEVDLHALGVTASEDYEAPVGELETLLALLMGDVLDHPLVGRNDSFDDLGFDSLRGIVFVSKAYEEGIRVGLQDLYNYPTVKLLATHVEDKNKPQASYADEDFLGAHAILASNCLGCTEDAFREVPVGGILLAGATGFLGAHILADFLKCDDGVAYCLVRGKDPNEAEERLFHVLSFYFGDEIVRERIKVLCADLQLEHFGLDDAEYESLSGKIDTVINAASSVKHYGSYEHFYEANVVTTEHLIDFCISTGAKLIHISTLSVSGNSFADDFGKVDNVEGSEFSEKDLYIGQPLDNVYARSKFEGEWAVLKAMDNGLRANIMRMGNLTNRLSDGVFQINYETNAFLRRLNAILELGAVPNYLMDLNVEFTPVDVAAHAVMTLVRHFSNAQNTFHVYNTKGVRFDKLLEMLGLIIRPPEVLDGETFADLLKSASGKDDKGHILGALVNDFDANGRLNYESGIAIAHDFTVQYLRKLGFEWPEIGVEYLRNYVNYFRRIGYWEV